MSGVMVALAGVVTTGVVREVVKGLALEVLIGVLDNVV